MSERFTEAEASAAFKALREGKQQCCGNCRHWAYSHFVKEKYHAPCAWPAAFNGNDPVPKVKLPPGVEIKGAKHYPDEGRDCPTHLRIER